MTDLLVILDRQHTGKPGRPQDTGGHSSFSDLSEARMVQKYLAAAEWSLRRGGASVIPLSDGAYHDRHTRARRYASRSALSIYVAGHLNAGGGDYGAVFHDHRSVAGASASELVSRALHAACPELDGTKVIPARLGHWTTNAYYTIRGVYSGRPCGICYEPAFMDNLDHAPLMTDEGLERIGTSLAKGIFDWAESVGSK